VEFVRKPDKLALLFMHYSAEQKRNKKNTSNNNARKAVAGNIKGNNSVEEVVDISDDENEAESGNQGAVKSNKIDYDLVRRTMSGEFSNSNSSTTNESSYSIPR